jgi:hypothetical protein
MRADSWIVLGLPSRSSESEDWSSARYCSAVLRDGRRLWLDAEPVHGPERKIQFRSGTNAKGSAGFIALAKEQLALITDDWFHGISFGQGLVKDRIKLARRRGAAPRGLSFGDSTAQTARAACEENGCGWKGSAPVTVRRHLDYNRGN